MIAATAATGSWSRARGTGPAAQSGSDENDVAGNLGDGVRVTGPGHQLRDNASGGGGDLDNGGCEFAVSPGGTATQAADKKVDGTPVVAEGPAGASRQAVSGRHSGTGRRHGRLGRARANALSSPWHGGRT